MNAGRRVHEFMFTDKYFDYPMAEFFMDAGICIPANSFKESKGIDV